jgi:formylmethanofuran dehydrogenase subunit A
MKRTFIFLACMHCCINVIWPQTYSIVIKDGHVIDPKNSINEVMDGILQLSSSGKSWELTLSVGSDADIAIINIREGKFGFWDYAGNKIEVIKKLECEMTIRGGKIVYDLNELFLRLLQNLPL